MSVQSILLEYTKDDFFFSSSAILLNKRWVLLPAASFILSLSSKKNIPTNLDSMETSKILCHNILDLTTENIKIISPAEKSKNFKFQLAKYAGIFSCNNIKETTDLPFTSGCDDNNNNTDIDFEALLSLFMIFDVHMEEKFQEKTFLECVYAIVRQTKDLSLSRGTTICVESTPFGTRELIASYSQGIICNVVGKNNIFVLIDAPTAPGCEGAPIYSFKNDIKTSTKIPIGMIISSLNWWRGEPLGLTLGVMLSPLLSQLLPERWTVNSYLFSNKNSVLRSAEKSIVQVFCGNGWGTGVLVNKKLGIFITAAHVVKTGKTDKIILKWRNKKLFATLLYNTETPPYDIAILSCTVDHVKEMVSIKIATKPCIKGENVLAAGYPIFNFEEDIFPVITKGNVSLADYCILHTTCCILPGSSGGAILRENGELLGITICHATVEDKNELIIYPRINTAVPISAISQILFEYFRTRDLKVLKTLETNETYIKNKWQLFKNKL